MKAWGLKIPVWAVRFRPWAQRNAAIRGSFESLSPRTRRTERASTTDARSTGTTAGGFVYFAQAGDGGPVKIGFALDVEKRLAALQTGSHEELRLLATMPGGRRAERELHRRFEAHRLRGEWFAPVPELLAFVETLASASLDLDDVRVMALCALTTGPLEAAPCPTWTSAIVNKLAATEPFIAAALLPLAAAAHLDERALCRLFEEALDAGAEQKRRAG